MTSKANNQGCMAFIDALVPFVNNNNTLHGAWVREGDFCQIGYLDKVWREELQATIAGEGSVYVVWSYGTPIAWWNAPAGEWVMPKRNYSVTTSRHQGIVRRGAKGLPIRSTLLKLQDLTPTLVANTEQEQGFFEVMGVLA